ncbi:hypothetical protein C9374_003838 [Naegleria lovaniensis]|uniref:Thioredoxin domain-containing protein n=1 Tax=Naegleria lovaniensis TaxID=51637 RepID=A0AA88KSZ8_NAELO|nr:uncharacterized protein C9374_003838 [Naegleria lovaniensis]KAG2394074.1 hypothetical protein C9374_003838 [Naegleria lovaniensis]
MSSSLMQVQSEKQFHDLVKKNELVVVYLKAEWCGVCTRFGPIVEKVSKEKEKVLFLVVDVDKYPTIPKELKAKAMPTFVFLLDGKEFSRIDGASEQMLQNYTDTLILQKQPSYMENGILHIVKEKDFTESLHNHSNCIVDFYADWCQPCKMISPSFEELAKNTTDVLFMKVNVDQLRNLMTKCRVTCMPTFCVFKNGKMKERIEGGSIQLVKKAIEDFSLTTEEYKKKDLMEVAVDDKFVMHVDNLNEYERLLSQHPRVVVDFFADWCGSCQQAAPKFSKLASQNPKVQFMMVNSDNASEICSKEGISSLPTFKLFAQGKEIKKLEGFNLTMLETGIKDLISSKIGTSKTKTTVNKSPTKPSPGKQTGTSSAPSPIKKVYESKSPTKPTNSPSKGTTKQDKPIPSSSIAASQNHTKVDVLTSSSPQKSAGSAVVKQEGATKTSNSILKVSPYLSSIPPYQSPSKEKVKKQKSPYLN